MINSLYESTLNDIKERLCEKNVVFNKYFDVTGNMEGISDSEEITAREIYDQMKLETPIIANLDLCTFIQKWRNDMSENPVNMNNTANSVTEDNDVDCGLLNKGTIPIFNYNNGTYRNNIPVVRPTIVKGRPAEFEPLKFIMECNDNNLGIPMDFRFEVEEDLFEDLEAEACQETLYMNESADNDLRYIAKIVAILNDRKFGYTLLELCGETHLHIK